MACRSNRSKLFALLIWLLPSLAAAQPITTLPPAALPLSGSETTYLVQGGVSKQTTVGNFTAASTIGQFASPPPIGATTPNTGAFTTLSATGAINTTSASGYEITGLPVINLLANQANPILSPETANAPDPNAVYFPQPLVVGYTATAGASTYESMVTTNLTIPGTVTNHYGMAETTLNLLGTGTMNGELNNHKFYTTVPSGLTISGGENVEAIITNNGTISGIWSGYTVGPTNNAGGTIAQAIGINFTPANNNTAGGSFGTSIGINCNTPAGAGTVANRFCVFNQDGLGEIANSGHYASRPDGTGGASPTAAATGGSVSLNSRATDTIFTVTETGSVTQVVVTLHKAAAGNAQYVCASPSGEVITSYTASVTSALTYNHSAGAGTVTCMGMDGF